MDVNSLSRIERLNYILGGLAAAVAALVLPGDQSLGLLVGAIIGSVNFSLIRRIVERWLTGAAEDTGGKSGLFMIPKMGALLAAVFLALRFLPISPVYLALGFSIFLPSIVIESVRSLTGPDQPNGA
jgi:uncharacterized membrane protein YeaQ/YmgE (transglycosylase-associated protein family)